MRTSEAFASARTSAARKADEPVARSGADGRSGGNADVRVHQRIPSRDERELEQLAVRLSRRTPSRYERLLKPAIDRVSALLLLLLLLPVILAISVAVLVVMGRPVLFGQARAGRGGSPFTMLKFRTMLPDRRIAGVMRFEGPERRMTHKSADDPRHTTLGRWLRKTSLDELPQLLHVLSGRMSLVGPRPELMSLVDTYTPWQRTRHVVRPGVTGLWQTTERGAGRLLHECVDLDLEYIAGMSLRRDVSILLRTPLALLRNKGVI
jgi:lipopolysaccharide/colanic/teichoic acid biosynthesis glycosyltransferase